MNAEARETQALIANPFSAPIVAAPTGAAAAALVQREVAEVQAAMVIAKAHPRDPRLAMDRILTACTRETLAENALYEYARGGQTVTGPSIRLAEEIARQWGNILCGVTELARNAGSSECLAYAWDLETNFRDEKRFTVRHWRDTKKGGYAITDERDIYELIANMGARRKRACILAVIPGDVTEAAVRQCDMTMKTREEVTPERLKALVEAFAKFGVTKEQLEKRIQRHLDSITPALLVNLRKIYNSLKDGMSQPGDWFEAPEGAASGESGSAPKSATDAVKEKLAQRRAKQSGGSEKGAAPVTTDSLRGDKQESGQENADASAGTDAEAATDNDLGGYVPQWNEKTAIAAAKKAESLQELDDLEAKVHEDFRVTRRSIPMSVEATFNDRREFLKQKQEL